MDEKAILGELYYRFVRGTRDWVLTCCDAPVPVSSKGGEGSLEWRSGNGGKHAAFIRELLTACCTFAETLWLPDELERRKNSLRCRHLTARAQRLTTVEPDLVLARFLLEHKDGLPSFLNQDRRDLEASPFDVLVWFHFHRYPDLKRRFLTGDFPPVQDLPMGLRRGRR